MRQWFIFLNPGNLCRCFSKRWTAYNSRKTQKGSVILFYRDSITLCRWWWSGEKGVAGILPLITDLHVSGR